MRLRNVKGSRETIADNDFCIKDYEGRKGHWNEVFGNDNPLMLEIGMGKGTFIMEMARRNPDINYIGIEKYSSVLVRALEKMEKEEDPPKNLFFIRMDAEYIEDAFDKGEVAGIYLNFSDPWPKNRYKDRRLTSGRFLARYNNILADDAVVEFKTDNQELFSFSLEEAGNSNWDIVYETRDLHHTPENEGNVMTEYEKKFSEKGNPICKMVIKR
ncbi:MAG: tRNA (guanosine(46)-N7)-methyltransferase TrmB [Eubacterium sp.]|nr:tRNA (guanosine(46)-N7)-methyltransferase TrmB [Eubacterium sp.]